MWQVCTKPFTITAGRKDVELGKLQMSESVAQLGHVTVSAKRQVFDQKIDRPVINVANSVTCAGTTALDVLESSRVGIMDHQNNTIALKKKWYGVDDQS